MMAAEASEDGAGSFSWAPPLTEVERAELEARLAQQQAAGDRVKPFWVNHADRESVRNWDRFYKRNAANFFKDRHYLTHEFTALTDLLTDANTENDTVAETKFIEIGCGVGNALFPLLSLLPNIAFFGCDCSKNAIELINQRKQSLAEGKSARLTAWVQDIVCEPFPDTVVGAMTHATLIFVLSALKPEDHTRTLTNCVAALTANGKLFIRDYAMLDYAQLRFQSSSILDTNFYLRSDGTRSYFFDLASLTALLESLGMRVDDGSVIEKSVKNRKMEISMRRRFVQIVATKVAHPQ